MISLALRAVSSSLWQAFGELNKRTEIPDLIHNEYISRCNVLGQQLCALFLNDVELLHFL